MFDISLVVRDRLESGRSPTVPTATVGVSF